LFKNKKQKPLIFIIFFIYKNANICISRETEQLQQTIKKTKKYKEENRIHKWGRKK